MFPEVWPLKFSVVIPLYNKAPYIKRAIDSVLNQTYQDFEIIVVDDGSTDGGGDIVASYTDPRIRLIRQENAGVSAARNRGIKEAHYNFIAFLDADDEWLCNHLETIYMLIQKYPNCSAYGTAYVMNSSGKIQFKSLVKKYPIGWDGVINIELYIDLSKIHPFIYSSTICVDKSYFYLAGMFKVGVNHSEDLAAWLKLCLLSPIGYNNKVTAIYHTDTDNRLCNSYTGNPYAYVFSSICELINDQNNNAIKSQLESYANVITAKWLAELFRRGDFEQFCQSICYLYPEKKQSLKLVVFKLLSHLPKDIFILLGKIFYSIR